MQQIKVTFTVRDGRSPSSETSDLALGVLSRIRRSNQRGENTIRLLGYSDAVLGDVEGGTRMRAIFDLEDRIGNVPHTEFRRAVKATVANIADAVTDVVVEFGSSEGSSGKVLTVGELMEQLSAADPSKQVFVTHAGLDGPSSDVYLVDTDYDRGAILLVATLVEPVETSADR